MRPPPPSNPALFKASFAPARNFCASWMLALALFGSTSMNAVTARIRGRLSAAWANAAKERARRNFRIG